MPIPKIDPLYTPNAELCSYGCNAVAQYFFVNSKKYCCSRSHTSCSANRKKNSNGLKSCGRNYKEDYQNLPQETKDRMGWNKGVTKYTDDRILQQSIRATGKRRITDESILKKVIYREQCGFRLAGIIDKIKGYNLLVEHGMYSKSNPSGVVRDHRISVNYGMLHDINPKIISHPANCEFLQHKDNARKTFKNSITLEELLINIENWCG